MGRKDVELDEKLPSGEFEPDDEALLRDMLRRRERIKEATKDFRPDKRRDRDKEEEEKEKKKTGWW